MFDPRLYPFLLLGFASLATRKGSGLRRAPAKPGPRVSPDIQDWRYEYRAPEAPRFREEWFWHWDGSPGAYILGIRQDVRTKSGTQYVTVYRAIVKTDGQVLPNRPSAYVAGVPVQDMIVDGDWVCVSNHKTPKLQHRCSGPTPAQLRFYTPEEAVRAASRAVELYMTPRGSALRRAPAIHDRSLDENFVDHFARTIFILDASNEADNNGVRLRGDAFNQFSAEATSESALARAEDWLRSFEAKNNTTITEAYNKLSNRPDDSPFSIEELAYNFAMEAAETGVGFNDDHPPHEYDLPHVETYDLAWTTDWDKYK